MEYRYSNTTALTLRVLTSSCVLERASCCNENSKKLNHCRQVMIDYSYDWTHINLYFLLLPLLVHLSKMLILRCRIKLKIL